MNFRWCLLAAICCAVTYGSAEPWPVSFAQEAAPAPEIFSGPQPGEELPPFKARGVLGDLAGQEIDLVERAKGKPLALMFVHTITRPSIGVTRTVYDYAARRAADGLETGVVFLTDDATETESHLKRAQHALPQKTTVLVYGEGLDGPGAYGLHRDVSLTMIVAKDNKVTANFALVQPSVAADAPRMAQAIVDVLGGGRGPKLEELTGGESGRQAMAMEVDLRPLLAPVIRPTATDEEIAAAAEKVDAEAEKNEAFRKKLGEAAARIVSAGKLSNYGRPAAQERLAAWAKKYGPKSEPQARPDKTE
jgi:hypothetical protein